MSLPPGKEGDLLSRVRGGVGEQDGARKKYGGTSQLLQDPQPLPPGSVLGEEKSHGCSPSSASLRPSQGAWTSVKSAWGLGAPALWPLGRRPLSPWRPSSGPPAHLVLPRPLHPLEAAAISTNRLCFSRHRVSGKHGAPWSAFGLRVRVIPGRPAHGRLSLSTAPWGPGLPPGCPRHMSASPP